MLCHQGWPMPQSKKNARLVTVYKNCSGVPQHQTTTIILIREICKAPIFHINSNHRALYNCTTNTYTPTHTHTSWMTETDTKKQSQKEHLTLPCSLLYLCSPLTELHTTKSLFSLTNNLYFGGGGFFLTCEDFGRMFSNSFPACAFFFFFKVDKLIPLFRSGSVRSGSVS